MDEDTKQIIQLSSDERLEENEEEEVILRGDFTNVLIKNQWRYDERLCEDESLIFIFSSQTDEQMI